MYYFGNKTKRIFSAYNKNADVIFQKEQYQSLFTLGIGLNVI